MIFVSVDLAMKYLMNHRNIFDKVKDSFLESYRNYEKDYSQFIENKDLRGLENYIHSVKGISLNLGAQILYDSAVLALIPIRNNEWNSKSLNAFFEVLGGTYKELESL